MAQIGFGCLRIGSSGGLCEHSNEPLGSIKKTGYFLTSHSAS
jgi:hypothetical protein